MEDRSKSRIIKELAAEQGFFLSGISAAQYLDEEAARLQKWLDQNYHGEMYYMANHFDKRVDPTKLVPGAKSVISLAYNYYNPKHQINGDAPKISMYAFGKDYHKVVRKKLNTLFASIKSHFGEVQGRVFVDSAPIMERDWAKRSGIGWIGKNTLLINPKKGSFFFLAEIVLDLVLDYDQPISDYCGSCTRCIDACPTKAIDVNGYLMDGSKCISYATIEHKGDIPTYFSGKTDNWIFGCDICQEVCPWNRFSTQHIEDDFMPKENLLSMTRTDWQELTEEQFGKLFDGSAVQRTGYPGLQRNISFLNDKEGT